MSVTPRFIRRTSLLLASTALFSLPAVAQTQETLWLGTLGSQRIMACLTPASTQGADNGSRYLYLRHGKPIALHRTPQQPTRWTEGPTPAPTGVWTVDLPADQLAAALAGQRTGPLTGQWAHPKKAGEALPITLTRFTRLADQDNGCALFEDDAAAWRAALDDTPKPGPQQTLGSLKLPTLSLAEGHAVVPQLAGDSAVIQDINQRLKNLLTEHAVAYYSCPVAGRAYVRGQSKGQPLYDASTTVTFFNARWLSLQTDVGGDCGGAHPFSGVFYTTLDMQTGRSVNLWRWIAGSRKADATAAFDASPINYTAPPKLNALIVRRAQQQRAKQGNGPADDCLDVIRDNSDYDIRLDTQGWVFTPMFPHAAQACTEDVRLTLAELQPFLTPQGKQATQTMQIDNR